MKDEHALWIIAIAVLVLVFVKLFNRGNYEETIFLEAGTYRVGYDIERGKCDVKASSGGGNFIVKNRAAKQWQIGGPIGITSGLQTGTFRNLILNRGDIIEVNGKVVIMLVPPQRIRNPGKEAFGAGIYRFGLDIPVGRYDLEVVSGDGDVLLVDVYKDHYNFFQDMSLENPFKADTFKNIECTSNFELWVNGNLQIKLHPSERPLKIFLPRE